MGVRDRFFTPQTAKAILSLRILIGVGVGAGMYAAGLGPAVSVGIGVCLYAVLVAVAMPSSPRRTRIDPFTLQEPWRQFVQSAQRSAARLHATIGATPDGPLKERLDAIAGRIDHGLDQAWRIARRGHEIDATIRRLDPTGLRSKRSTLEARSAAPDRRPNEQAATGDDDDVTKALASVDAQLVVIERLERQSAGTVDSLRLTQTRLDELVVRAAEISVGAGDTDAYEHDVDDLVVELEALRLAIEETRTT